MRADLSDTVQERRRKVKNDPTINALMTRDPDDIATWIENNVNTMDDAKDLLKRLAVMVSVLARREFPDW